MKSCGRRKEMKEVEVIEAICVETFELTVASLGGDRIPNQLDYLFFAG